MSSGRMSAMSDDPNRERRCRNGDIVEPTVGECPYRIEFFSDADRFFSDVSGWRRPMG